MKNEHSNIDELFKDQLHDFESEPSLESWETIRHSIPTKEVAPAKSTFKLSKLIPYGMVATVGLIVLGVIYLNLNRSTQIATNETINTGDEPVEIYKQKIDSSKTSSIDEKITPVNIEITQKSANSKKVVFLPDGTKVYLNKNSEITYDENFSDNRIVHLVGEAYFEIKNNSSSPFKVYSQLAKTEVEGSKLMVSSIAQKGYDEVYVVSGKVVVFDNNSDKNKLVLSQGEKAIIKSRTKILKQKNDDINFDSWKSEKIVFENTKLREVIITLEKYFAVSIEVNNPEVYQCRFTGTYEKSDINEILQVLAVTFNLTYNQKESKYMISGKGCN